MFSVCIVTCGAVCASVWEVWVFCHANLFLRGFTVNFI